MRLHAPMKQLSLLGKDDSPGARREVTPAAVSPELAALAAEVPRGVRLGTSSWSFPGWAGLVYGAERAWKTAELADGGLAAYAKHPLFRTVGIDRGFYAPIPEATLAEYAAMVPDDFRFLVKAPALVTDAATRDGGGAPIGVSESFLDAARAIDTFVGPVTRALGEKAGPLVFQISPLPSFAAPECVVQRLGDFLAALPRGPVYGVEVRDPSLLGGRLREALAASGARYVTSVHARMPPVAAQLRFARALGPGPFVARWNLLAGATYETAKASFAPFDRIVVPDESTREALAEAAFEAARAGSGAFVIANNKAEGSAPLTLEALARAITRSSHRDAP